MVEMMVVAGIFVITGSLSVSAYNGYSLTAQIARAVTEIRMIDLLIKDYSMNRKSNPPDLLAIGIDYQDPWGNVYAYLDIAGMGEGEKGEKGKGKVRKDKNLVPINTDFDLYSMGPDGKTAGPLTAKASKDDVVRANNGRYVGVASGY